MKWTDQSPDNSVPVIDEEVEFPRMARMLCPAQTDDAPIALIAPNVHQNVLHHLRANSIEQGGLLIGVPYATEDGAPHKILILDSAAAPESSGTGYSLRMEGAVWTVANAKLAEQKNPSARIVGWYHSHPGLGAFFSSTDMKTQADFFHHSYSVGWVIDPSDDTHACFVGPRSVPIGCGLYRM